MLKNEAIVANLNISGEKLNNMCLKKMDGTLLFLLSQCEQCSWLKKKLLQKNLEKCLFSFFYFFINHFLLFFLLFFVFWLLEGRMFLK